MELARFPSRGRFSVRSIFTFALAAFTTVLLWVLLSSTPVGAADASWNGAAIEHSGRTHYLAGTTSDSDSLGLPSGSRYYVSLEQTPTSTGPAGLQKAYVIYLAPGTDPPGSGTATSVTYDYDTATKKFSNPSGSTAITIDTASFTAQATTCAIESVGWIVCPTMNFLAWGMDTVFGWITEFMKVQPLQVNNTDGALYNAWNIMRSIANVAFIIVFLIIIYSQLTSVGIGNYGIKKMLPRLIIAAIAINVSYIICAIAVDISNILGYSIHDALTGLRNTLLATGVTDPAADANLISFESITGFVLSGGTAVVAGGLGLVGASLATGGTVLGAVFILLPALVGLVLTVLVVLLILAARQALIVILIIIAPLALVAFLLPNTEKWFEKWRETFMTMLIFFPAFSLVFGGSQLAGGVIIQNASSLNMIILGLIVQVAPLVITPLLLRFSGSVLGGVAKLINDPNKGLLDRTRNWSKGHSDWHAERGRGGLDRNGNPIRDKNGNEVGLRKRNALRQSSRYLDQRKRRLSDRTDVAKAATQDAYENSGRYTKTKRDGSIKLDRNGKVKADLSQQKAYFDHKKEQTHAHHADVVDQARRTQGSMLFDVGISSEAAKERAERSKNQTAQFYNELRSDRNYANKVGGGALHMSSYNLEVSKAGLEESQNHVKVYYDMQRATAGTELHRTVRGLETSKLNVEIAGNNVTTMVENMKRNVNSDISVAARNAQSSKEHLEVAQNQLQVFFDTRRATEGTELNLSTIRLERSKSTAEDAKAKLTAYVTDERSTGSLQDITMRTEGSKQLQQEAESRLTRVIKEYKAGGEINAETGKVFINGKEATADQRQLAEDMLATTARIAAEDRGATSADYVQQSKLANLFNGDPEDPETGELTQSLLRTARGIDPNGKIRAQANAISQLDKLKQESLSNSVTLLGDQAEKKETTIVNLAKEMYAKQVGHDANGNPVPREEQDPSLLEAAFEALAKDGAIPILRDARLAGNSEYIDQDMLTSLFARHSGTMKAKGGFDLQANPKLAGATREEMDISIANSLGDVAASNIADQKAGWWEEVSETLPRIIGTADAAADAVAGMDPESDEYKKAEGTLNALKNTYHNVTMALTNPNVLKDIGDRLEYTIKIHQELHRKFNDPEMAVDYDLARKGQAPARKNRR